MAGTLTVANSSIVLSVAGLFDAPVPLQGYGPDEVFSAEPVTHVETMMGLDRHLSGGWVPAERPVNITLMGDSESNFLFEEWVLAEEQVKDKLIATMFISVFAISRVYTCNKGFLRSSTSMPDARRILQTRRYTIVFESIVGNPQ